MGKPIVAPIARSETRQCLLTPPWFVQGSEYNILPAKFELLTNGEEAFPSVYEAIEAARKSICIICWGFQPSMYFKRGGKPGLMIGELLEKKAIQGVKVRVLCWSMEIDLAPGLPEANVSVTGFTEANTPGRRAAHVPAWEQPTTMSDDAFAYDQQWFSRYDEEQSLIHDTLARKLSGMDTKAKTPNLKFAGRGFSAADRASIATSKRNDPKTSATTRAIQAAAASHHQKMVIVDFEDPDHAVGFVMGHNMLDEYWDTSDHSYKRQSDPRQGRNGARPREDFSSRITGPMLGDLFHNFSAAWKKETNEDLMKTVGAPAFERYPLSGATRGWEKAEQQKARADAVREQQIQTQLGYPAYGAGQQVIDASKARQKADDARAQSFKDRLQADADEAKIREAEQGTRQVAYQGPVNDNRGQPIMGQILRTQPQYGVRDIAKAYLQAVNNATQYIYIENQYFRWPVLAEKIKACADGQAAWGRTPETHGPLYLFVITNADKGGMGDGTVNTARMLDSLGRADALPAVSREVRVEDTEAELRRARLSEAQARSRKIQAANALGVARDSTSRKRADNELVAAQQQEKDARAQQVQLQQKIATQQQASKDQTAIVPENLPNLKVHVCTLVSPDTPGRSGTFLNAREGHSERGLTREERLARAKDELTRSENEAERLRFLHRQISQGQMYSPASSYELENRHALDARLAAEKKQRDELMQRCQAEEARSKQLRQEIDALKDGSDPIDWVDVYIHAKLMIIDDTFMTLGSANINSRSMETDSELNIIHERHTISEQARRKLWGLHTKRRDGGSFSGGEALNKDGMKLAHKHWDDVIKQNKIARKKKWSPIASLVEFFSATQERTDKD